MKKWIFAIVVAAVGVAHAKEMKDMEKKMGPHDTLDGCGLGWQVTDSRTMVATTTRMTTNAFVPPSFGMTSGTIGCEQISFAANDKEAVTFVATNYHELRSELAEGQGEYVSAMIESFGCKASAVPEISSRIQKNYNTVVAPVKDAGELFHNLKKEIGQCS